MNIIVRQYNEADLSEMIKIWNEVVEDGIAFPQEEILNDESGKEFFASQTYCAVAADSENGNIYGLYILHPNNVGRCGHICNASYALLNRESRDCTSAKSLFWIVCFRRKKHGFGILQFNAVVSTNIHARHLYERLGFVQLGTIPKVLSYEGWLL